MECVFESVELHSRAVLIDSQVEVSQSLNLQEAQRLESKTLSQVQDKSMVIGFPSLQPDADKPADHERVRSTVKPLTALLLFRKRFVCVCVRACACACVCVCVCVCACAVDGEAADRAIANTTRQWEF